MTALSASDGSPEGSRVDHDVWPGIGYDAPHAARDWLRALGFTDGIVVPGVGEGQIQHSEMLWPEGGRVMVHSRDARTGPLGAARGDFSVYVVVDDPDAVYARAAAVGSPVLRELEDTDYGSRDFSVADPEGNCWSFGTYAG
jgi:uncharacterized glyoxalase superfamily protein PhnB